MFSIKFFQKNIMVAVLASVGVILAASYMLWLYKRVIFGDLIKDDLKKLIDLNRSEIIILWSLAIPTVLFGFYPDPLLSTTSSSVEGLINLFNTSLKIYTASTL